MAVAAVFGQAVGFKFLDYDDPEYLDETPQVTDGLSLSGVLWAFTHVHAVNWHPLTTISHMADCQIYGFDDAGAWGHHLGNVLLHAATTVLLFLVLRKMTGALWTSALATALFAVHPLRAESVAWVAERKDVLSGLFFVLTLWAYAFYVARPASWTRYALVALTFSLGLMAKPMLVTVPFVLLLLDYWPLGRIPLPGAARNGPAAKISLRRAVLEKVPLLVLSAASSLATMIAQGTAVIPLGELPMAQRLANVPLAYVAYVKQTFYPASLWCLYLHPFEEFWIWKAAVATALLLAATAAAFAWRRNHPWLLVGWLWFLGMLVPVIGIVQVGTQSMADRYTYLPQIGIAVIVAWTAAELAAQSHWAKPVVATAAVLAIAVLASCGWRQVGFWQDDERLWTHALDCDGNNPFVHNNFGNVLLKRRRLDDAIGHYREALRINPRFPLATYNLGHALRVKGEREEGLRYTRKAIELDPRCQRALNDLGTALDEDGKLDDAVACYRQALQVDPNHAVALYNLGHDLVEQGKLDEGIECDRKAIQANPRMTDAYYNLGVALAKQGKLDEAIEQYEKALRIDSNYVKSLSNLGKTYLQQEKLEKAAECFRKLLALDPKSADAQLQLADICRRQGKPDEAIAHYRRVVDADPNNPTRCYELAKLLHAQGNVGKAAELYLKTIKLNPRLAEAHNDLGLLCLKQGDAIGARMHIEEALRIDPRNARFHNSLGNIFQQQGKPREAAAEYEKALQIDPRYAHAHFNLAEVLSQQGKLDEAAVHYQRTVELRPDYQPARQRLADIQAKRKGLGIGD